MSEVRDRILQAAENGTLWDTSTWVGKSPATAPRIQPSQAQAVLDYREAVVESNAAQAAFQRAGRDAKRAESTLFEAGRAGEPIAEFTRAKEDAALRLNNGSIRRQNAFEALRRAEEAARAVGVQAATFQAIREELNQWR